MLSSALIPPQRSVPKLVKISVLAEWLDVSTASIRNYVRQGILPQPIRFSVRRVYFNTAEVRATLQRLEQPKAPFPAESPRSKPKRKRRVAR